MSTYDLEFHATRGRFLGEEDISWKTLPFSTKVFIAASFRFICELRRIRKAKDFSPIYEQGTLWNISYDKGKNFCVAYSRIANVSMFNVFSTETFPRLHLAQ